MSRGSHAPNRAGAETSKTTLRRRRAAAELGVGAVVSDSIPAPQSSRAHFRDTCKEPTQEMLDERRALYDYFIELYRQNKNRKPTEIEIAITAQYRDRSAVAKYLNGTASERCAQDVEKVLNMMPDEFDERRIKK